MVSFAFSWLSCKNCFSSSTTDAGILFFLVILLYAFREDLGKGINTDEAAALGAVYQAAHLGKGFKVKKFAIRDAVLYPVEVNS